MSITLPERPAAPADDGEHEAPHGDLAIAAGTSQDKAIGIAGDPQRWLSCRFRALIATLPGR
jgi:hypothetical protein